MGGSSTHINSLAHAPTHALLSLTLTHSLKTCSPSHVYTQPTRMLLGAPGIATRNKNATRGSLLLGARTLLGAPTIIPLPFPLASTRYKHKSVTCEAFRSLNVPLHFFCALVILFCGLFPLRRCNFWASGPRRPSRRMRIFQPVMAWCGGGCCGGRVYRPWPGLVARWWPTT